MNYLRELCKENNIKLIITKNKNFMLSGAIINNNPVLRANRIFLNCPKNVAKAVIDYYLKLMSFELIYNYVIANSSSKKPIINAPDKKFLSYFKPVKPEKRKLIEYKIINITTNGNEKKAVSENEIPVYNGRITDLKIVVKKH